ncbi:endonuclease MutS2 [Rossellomorea vietnamensis]|uniref:Endonuclease MutS2 n=1 Tax=Rossellomorea vietnamensis TaxID=218284 RepID=A0A5D4KBK3_9BACI|nr:endonuclease MutS2 [Rossellomorea vietnamensis]TYR74045.1 endonuclease MutS2 [Rossellomorea vietnamensis]
MNENTFKQLDFQRIKEEIASYALTDSGKGLVKSLSPSFNKKQIAAWLDEVTEAVEILNKSESVPIHALDGIELILSGMNKGTALRAVQFQKLLLFLDCCGKLKRFMKDKEFIAPRVSSYVYSIEDLPGLYEEISRCIRNGQVDDYASKELLKVRKQISIGEERLKEKVSSMLKSNKYKTYIQEAIVSQRAGRYVIPVKKEYKGKVKGAVLDASASGSTLYIEPEEVGAQQDQLLYLKMEEESEVESVLLYLTGLVQQHEKELKLAVEIMINYDHLFAKAKYSKAIGGNAVELNESHYISLKNARHPLLRKDAVPLNIEMGGKFHALVITGPNTGGKTVSIKTVGLLTLMAQCGIHVPVEKGSHISIFQKILLDIGDGQNLQQNLSTFSSHVKNIIEILQEANDRSLILLDELGSGTDPGEGMGLATAILQKLYDKGATLLATTHYSEIKDFADREEGFINGSMEFDLETLEPTYRLIVGRGGESQAFSIALKLGMHPEIIEAAHRVTYKENRRYDGVSYDDHMRKEQERQVAVNRYAKRERIEKETHKTESPQFVMGDNVKVSPAGEIGIVEKGPDKMGSYTVWVKGEKREVNHKRLELYISAKELYPEDYDFDIVFKSKDYRKKSHQMNRRHDAETVIYQDEHK